MAISKRPNRLPPGTPLSEHYSIEGLVRLAEGRMFYLASDNRPDQPNRYCWHCAETNSPRSGRICISCGQEMPDRRFLVSLRWEQNLSENFVDYFQKDIQHPTLIAPVDTFYENNSLVSIVHWSGQDFLLNLSAPLQSEQVLEIAQRAIGLLAYYHRQGVSLENIQSRNFLFKAQTQEFFFFDPEVRKVYKNLVPEAERGREIPSLATMLKQLTANSDTHLIQIFQKAERGHFASPYDFGRALEKLVRQNPPVIRKTNIAAMSDVGLIRNLNEDNWSWFELNSNLSLYVVADGMGGHDRGEIASQMAVSIIGDQAHKMVENHPRVDIPKLEQILESAFQNANNSIKEFSERVGSDMGTTMVAAMVVKQEDQVTALLANVGDSRAYLVRNNTLHQVSKDHSLVARMVEQNQITAEEARTHPHSNILLRTVGTERNVSIDIFRVGLEKNDIILLCSDGLWGEVDDPDMQEIINRNTDLQQSCRELLRAAHLGGGRDNCTIMMVQLPT